jgi:hypothetical protein
MTFEDFINLKFGNQISYYKDGVSYPGVYAFNHLTHYILTAFPIVPELSFKRCQGKIEENGYPYLTYCTQIYISESSSLRLI